MAFRLLEDWPASVPSFRAVVPHDTRHTRQATPSQESRETPPPIPLPELQPVLDGSA